MSNRLKIIPASMRQHIDDAFIDRFVVNLQKSLHCEDELEAMRCTQLDMGCAGWAIAFEKTCHEMEVPGIYEYWATLRWDESDLFDAEVAVIAKRLFDSRGIDLGLPF